MLNFGSSNKKIKCHFVVVGKLYCCPQRYFSFAAFISLIDSQLHIKIVSYSPKTYCYNQINQKPDDEKTIGLMASILNYGAAAQIYFDYKTDDLMNSDLPEELK